MTSTPVPFTPSLPADLRQVAAYVDASLAPATRRA